MKMRFNYFTCAVLAIILLFSGCAKEEDLPDDPGTGGGTPVAKGDFRWTINNGTTVVADSSICYAQITTIYAYKSGLANTIELTLSDLVVGTYSISSVTGNELKYVNNGTSLSANQGSIKITSNSSGKMSGTFSGSMPGATVTTVNGSFTDIRSR